jgi:hypothetical protein
MKESWKVFFSSGIVVIVFAPLILQILISHGPSTLLSFFVELKTSSYLCGVLLSVLGIAKYLRMN